MIIKNSTVIKSQSKSKAGYKINKFLSKMTKNTSSDLILTLFGVCLLVQSVQTYEFSAKFISEYSEAFGQNIYDQVSKMSAIQDLRIVSGLVVFV